MEAEAITSEFNYFEPELKHRSISREFDKVINPLAALAKGSQIEFHIPAVDRQFLSLRESWVEVKCKITQPARVDLGANNHVGPANNIIHSLFKTIEVELNGTVISDANSLYPYRAYAQTITSYGKDTLDTRMRAEGFIFDTAGAASMPNTAIDGDNRNAGYIQRSNMFARSREVTLCGRPNLDIFQTDRCIPPNVEVRLRFSPSNDNFILMCPAPARAEDPNIQYEFHILSMRLYIHVKEVIPQFELVLQENLRQMPYRIPYRKITCKHLSIPTGNTTFEQDIFDTIPDRVIIMLLGEENHSGHYNRNPFHLKHYNLLNIGLKVNSMPLPMEPLQFDFTNANYIRGYLFILHQLGLAEGDKALAYSPQDWAGGNTLFAFKLVAGPIGEGIHHIKPRESNVRLEIRFPQGQPNENVSVIIIAEYPSNLYIFENREIRIETL